MDAAHLMVALIENDDLVGQLDELHRSRKRHHVRYAGRLAYFLRRWYRHARMRGVGVLAHFRRRPRLKDRIVVVSLQRDLEVCGTEGMLQVPDRTRTARHSLEFGDRRVLPGAGEIRCLRRC